MRHTISHYEVLECLGSGGTCEVYRAEDLTLKRSVALKILPPGSIPDQEAKTWILEEARAAAALNHPHIATVYELGQTDQLQFIAMEYVEGQPLSSVINQGQLTLKLAIDVAVQIAEALSSAHQRGIIHCDIKSSNIMLTAEGVVKVLDFGLARVVQRASIPTMIQDASLSDGRKGMAASADRCAQGGTLCYMSPEQLSGGEVDSRTDIFSLGVLLYEMLTGLSPFERDTIAAVQEAILRVEPTPLGVIRNDAPLELESIVRRALQKDRELRYPGIGHMLADLNRLRERPKSEYRHTLEPTLENQGSRALQPLTGLVGQASRRRKWLLAVGVLLALAAVVDGLILSRPLTSLQRDAALLVLASTCLICYRVMRRKSPTTSLMTETAAAFRGLLPFQEADRDRFYGREGDLISLFEKVGHSEFRFGVLFGESGCGKTSLIKAALIPRLWEAGYVPVYCRSYRDPLASVVEECRRQTQVAPHDGEAPIDYLRRASRSESSILIIICDQFEEFFINFKNCGEREPFASFVAACYGDSALQVKFLFSMRSDFLYQISAEFGDRIAEPLLSSRLFQLRNFDVEKAVEVIEKSARQAGVPFEAGLSLHLARELAAGGVVLPSELQIVGERLQSKRIYTVQAYRRAGGKEPLMHSFLEDVIGSSGDGEGARLLLRTLISEENTRATLPLDEIVKRTQRSRASIDRLLTMFIQSRLIREIQEDEPWCYELMHEYLIEKINQTTGRVMDATQRANRLFRQYLSQYVVERRARIPLRHLWFIRRYTDVEKGERERELLRKSWQWGLVKGSTLALLLAVVTTLAAAWTSVREEWEGMRFKDGHRAAVRRAAFSPDGRLLVTVGEDNQVIVWNFSSRERLATFNDHTDWITSVAFSPDGRWFATGSRDQTAIVWEAERLQKSAVLGGHPGEVNAIAFSPDGRMLATSSLPPQRSEEGTILWRVGNWEKIARFPFGAHETSIPFFSRDSRYLINQESEPDTWDVMTGRPVADQFDTDWCGNSIALSPDARLLVGVGSDGLVIFTDVMRRQIISRYPAHQDNGRAAAFSPDGRLAATGAEVVILWDAITQQKITSLEYPSIVWSVVFSPNGLWLVSTHGDGTIQVWDVAERRRVVGLNEHSDSVRTVAWSRDGKKVASAGEDRSIIIWDGESGRKETVLMGHTTRVVGAGFTPDGSLLASVDGDGLLIVWDLERRHPRLRITHPKKGFPSYCLAVSPDGRLVATSHGVYEITTGRQVADFHAEAFGADPRVGWASYGMTFSVDGKLLAHTGLHYLTLLDTTTWQVIDSAESDKKSAQPPLFVSFSADRKWLATGDDKGEVLLWSAQPLKEVAVLGRHTSRIKSVAFSPDSRQVASAGDDQTICLWDVNGRRLVTRIGTHTAPVLSVAFSPDGRQIVSGEHDKSVRLHTRNRTLWGYRLD